MTVEEHQSLQDRYEAKFGNLDEIAMPQLLLNSRFAALLESALNRGVAVTDHDMETTFPDEGWEVVKA